jgi:hypothetical protein
MARRRADGSSPSYDSYYLGRATIYFPKNLKFWLETTARRNGTSLSAYVCEVIQRHAESHGYKDLSEQELPEEAPDVLEAKTDTPTSTTGKANIDLLKQIVILLQETLNDAQKCFAYL